MTRVLSGVQAGPDEVAAARPGDGLVSAADVVMDRAFTVSGAPEAVWPWLLQLGKSRAGWYLPRPVERLIPRSRRAARAVNPAWQQLRVGDVIPDYGGRDATFEVAELSAPDTLVYRSRRGRIDLTWSITLRSATGAEAGPATRVHLRLRLGGVRRTWLAESAGGLVDLLTIAGLAAGLRDRLPAGRAAA
jgi:hypothetical protein